MNAERLEEWRAIVRGEAGFNGQPQALLKLMQVSDRTNLLQLRLAYPEAVRAFLEERGDESPEDGGPIRLTMRTNVTRAAPKVMDTDDLGDAIAQYAIRHFGREKNSGPDKWIVAFIVEQRGAEYTAEEVAHEFTQIASLERLQARQ